MQCTARVDCCGDAEGEGKESAGPRASKRRLSRSERRRIPLVRLSILPVRCPVGIAQQADESGVRVLFEGADVLAVANEAGVAMQPDSREDTGAMANLVIGYLRHASCRPHTGAPLGAVPEQSVRFQCRCAPLLRPSAEHLPLRLDQPRP